jgi:hypothetical protein
VPAAQGHSSACRLALGRVLEHHWTQLAILTLLVVDVACVVGEIMLVVVCEHHAPAPANETSTAEHHRLLEGTEPTTTSFASQVELGLHITSLFILSVFAAQLLGLMISYGLRAFVRHCFYLVDLTVVVVAIVLESLSEPSGEIIIVLLFWRALRVVHGLLASGEVSHHEVQHLRKRIHGVRQRLFCARSYTATTLRLLSMHVAARDILRWWRAVKAPDGAAAADAADITLLAARGPPVETVCAEERDEAIEDLAALVRHGARVTLPADERAAARRIGRTETPVEVVPTSARSGAFERMPSTPRVRGALHVTMDALVPLEHDLSQR